MPRKPKQVAPAPFSSSQAQEGLPAPETPVSPSLETLESLSALQLYDLLVSGLSVEAYSRPELHYLRRRIEELEEMTDQARQVIEKLDAAVQKLSSPANRIGTLLALPKKDTALVAQGGGEFYCGIDPRLAQVPLLLGTRVLLNEAYAVIGDLGFDANGPVVKIQDVLEDGRLRIGAEMGGANAIVMRSAALAKERLKTGLDIRLDASQRVALEVVAKPSSKDLLLENVPVLPWDKIGGQQVAVQAVRDAIELPFLHSDLFKSYQHSTPKGFLLYGPPGCGKTLIGKATAYNLTRQLKEQTGQERPEYFLNVKGPEILNMWVGESERQVRELFARAREKAKEGFLPFIFIDECESILGTRRGGRHSSILSTLVPMFCAEMDGIESLHDMVIILASNRADLIDPAILRPGRIDRKIKVSRPTREGAKEIYRIYLTPDLPLDPAVLAEYHGDAAAAFGALADKLVEKQFAATESNRFLQVTFRSGKTDYLHRGDLVSGAIIASIVERAKEYAIKRTILHPEQNGLRLEDLLQALEHEYKENDIFPPSDITEDWLKLVDYDPESVVKLSPVRAQKTETRSGVV